MPTSELPENPNHPNDPGETNRETGSGGESPAPALNAEPQPQRSPDVPLPELAGVSSRWVNYETHELLEMISELEDERRWARLREGVLWAVLAHMALLIALFLLPKYVFNSTPVVVKNPQDKDFTYLDSPEWRPKTPPKPLLEKPQIDKKTLDEIQKQAPQAPVQQQQQQPQAQQQTPAPAAPAQPTPPAQQSQVEAPRPAAVPARPNFAMGSSNPMDALKDAMRGAAHNRGTGDAGSAGAGRLRMHPGAGSGGVEVLSDTQGVDFSAWLHAWHYETEKTWDPLIPDEVNAPIYKSGMVAIRFKVLPNGRLMDGSLVLEGRSGDVALDRAAWGALTGSNYPALPRDFHGPYLELRAFFLYNTEPRR
jgi:outer membrane biosynthesis protein TonB